MYSYMCTHQYNNVINISTFFRSYQKNLHVNTGLLLYIDSTQPRMYVVISQQWGYLEST